MFEKAVRKDPHMIEFVPDQHKMQEKCNKAIKEKNSTVTTFSWSV